MTLQTRRAAQTYASVGVQSSVMSADPHRLIEMLFDGAHAALKRSQRAIEVGDFASRATQLSKAIDIIERGLRAALDLERGGELAQRLDALYSYMIRRLMQANLRKDAAMVGEVNTLLEQISSGWKEIGNQAPGAR